MQPVHRINAWVGFGGVGWLFVWGPVQTAFLGIKWECVFNAALRHSTCNEASMPIFSRYPEMLGFVITGDVDFLFEYVK